MNALEPNYEVHAFGPGRADVWPLPPRLLGFSGTRLQRHLLRGRPATPGCVGTVDVCSFSNDRAIGGWAADQIQLLKPDLCYVFTQVGLETLQWAQDAGIPTVLESPNGHLRNFRRVYEKEAQTWGSGAYRGHPSPAMVERVEREYALADQMRVSSRWSKVSLTEYGVEPQKVHVFEQPLNLLRFRPPGESPPAEGPLRICFVGSLDLRKGFVYLLGAMKLLGPGRVKLEIVGATGDRLCKELFARESAGIDLECAPGDRCPLSPRGTDGAPNP